MKKSTISNLFVLLLIALCFEGIAQSSAALAHLDTFIQQQAQRYHIPGIAVGVVKGDQLVWSKGYGYANLAQQTPMSAEGVINIASISKTFTATAIMQLWEKGQLQLDVDVNTYIPFKLSHPKFPDQVITIRQLLTHTSGIKDGPAYKEGYACGDPIVSLKDWIESCLQVGGAHYYVDDNFLPSRPAEVRRYSNVAFGLLGYIVESITQQKFHLYVKENILEPLGMSQTGYLLSEIDTQKIVTPYLYLGPLQKGLANTSAEPLPYFNPYCWYSFWNYPDGLIRTSVEDLAKYAAAYMNGGVFQGRRILKASTIDKMQRAQLSKEINEDQDQGLSWFYSPGLAPSWFHGGSDPGVSTRLYVDKENKISVIVLQNANADNAFYIAKKLYQTFSKS